MTFFFVNFWLFQKIHFLFKNFHAEPAMVHFPSKKMKRGHFQSKKSQETFLSFYLENVHFTWKTSAWEIFTSLLLGKKLLGKYVVRKRSEIFVFFIFLTAFC
jgi:hypothetical protein